MRIPHALHEDSSRDLLEYILVDTIKVRGFLLDTPPAFRDGECQAFILCFQNAIEDIRGTFKKSQQYQGFSGLLCKATVYLYVKLAALHMLYIFYNLLDKM